MSFDQFETADGQPIELLTFQNGNDQFFRSNTVRPITVLSNVYTPLAYDGSPFSQSKDSDDSDIRMVVPNDFEVVALYDGPLTSSLTFLTINRFHANDPAEQLVVHWAGRLTSVQHREDTVTFLLRPVTAGNDNTPSDVFSGVCNDDLFETPGCNLLRDNFRHIGTVGAIDATGFLITIPGLRLQAATLDLIHSGPTGPLTSGELDIYWEGGHIQTGAGEIRSIVEGNISGDPDQVRVEHVFRSLAVTNGLSVFAGCDFSMATCHKKFNNAINFQGFPYIPEIDPANTELPPGTRTSSSRFSGVQV